METDSYRDRLAALREENEFLRAAAHSFGELAERLAGELRQLRTQTELAVEPPVATNPDAHPKDVSSDLSFRR
jgi:hypothetical protein